MKMNAIELMTKKSESYLQSIKNSCNEKLWNSTFEDRDFIAQCFDDIQNEVMSKIHGKDYYNPTDWANDDTGRDYEATCDIRTDFTDAAYLYVLEKKEIADPESWDK
jgi:hypothetical protein